MEHRQAPNSRRVTSREFLENLSHMGAKLAPCIPCARLGHPRPMLIEQRVMDVVIVDHGDEDLYPIVTTIMDGDRKIVMIELSEAV